MDTKYLNILILEKYSITSEMMKIAVLTRHFLGTCPSWNLTRVILAWVSTIMLVKSVTQYLPTKCQTVDKLHSYYPITENSIFSVSTYFTQNHENVTEGQYYIYWSRQNVTGLTAYTRFQGPRHPAVICFLFRQACSLAILYLSCQEIQAFTKFFCGTITLTFMQSVKRLAHQ